jgi:putative ABC transport system permease protein
VTGLAADLRLALRRLARAPAFTTAAGLTLALGFGANIATFTLANTALLRPLPYEDPERLTVVWSSKTSEGKREEKVSPADFLDWRREARSFETLVGWTVWGVALSGSGEPQELTTVRTSPGLLRMLGAAPALGRDFLPEDETPGRHHVVLLSHATWLQRFAGDSAVLGRSVTLDGVPHRIVGVLPAGFRFPDDGTVALWAPLAFDGSELVSRAERRFNVLGRLRAGVSLESARQELATVAARLAGEHPETNAGWGVTLQPAEDVAAAGSRRPLAILVGAAGLVLLLACANVAHLFLIRGLDRERELAVRTALGAPRGSLVRLLAMESVLVTLFGGAMGLALATWLVPLVQQLDPGLLSGWRAPEIDGVVALATAGALGLVALASGLLPALRAVRAAPRQGMAGRRSGSGSLIAAEVALAVVLLVGAGLLLRSLDRLLRVDPGFNPERVVAATVFLSGSEYDADERQSAFFEQLVAGVRALPGVTAAGAVTTLPMNPIGIDYDLPFAHDGRKPARAADQPQVDFRVAEGDYFRAVGVPLLRGRGFASTDRAGTQRVVIVNETLTRRYFAGADPVGRVVWVGGGIGQATVVGVVGDVRHRGLTDRPRPELYVPSAQYPHGGMTVVARTSGDPLALARALKEQVYALDADQPITELAALPDLVSRSVAPRRFQVGLLGGFAGLALLLAGVGVYGVVAYAVGRRTRELGVRIALGADAGEIRRAVLGPGLRPALLGVAIGAAAAWGLTGVLRNELYEITPHDPATYAVAVLTLLLVAWAACAAPARRAVRTDPGAALRSE